MMSCTVGWILSSSVPGMAVNSSRSQQDGRVVDTPAPRLLGRDLPHELRQRPSPQRYAS